MGGGELKKFLLFAFNSLNSFPAASCNSFFSRGCHRSFLRAKQHFLNFLSKTSNPSVVVVGAFQSLLVGVQCRSNINIEYQFGETPRVTQGRRQGLEQKFSNHLRE